jgi:hypothetical protein
MEHYETQTHKKDQKKSKATCERRSGRPHVKEGRIEKFLKIKPFS